MGRSVPAAAAAAGGIHFTDPRNLARLSLTATGLNTRDSNTNSASNVAAFWADIAETGTVVDSNFTSDTYKTIYQDASGRGLVSSIIGPTADASETTTFRITVDDVETEVAVAVTSGNRVVLGNIAFDDTIFTTAADHSTLHGAFDAGKSVFTSGSGTWFIPAYPAFIFHSLPCLQYTTSLHVEIKHSDGVTDAGGEEDQSGVIHVVQD